MISIPCAVPAEPFKRQISFFQYQHNHVYGSLAKEKAIIPIVRYNHYGEKPIESIDWDFSLPYKIVNSVHDFVDGTETGYLPINVFTAAKQIIENLPDEEVVEIIDADLVHLRPYPEIYDNIGYDLVIADNIYEDWHMHISKPSGSNRGIINKYLTHNENLYMNGGFNVIGRVKTIKLLMDDIIKYSSLITKEHLGTNHSWWCAMYGLNISCHNNRVKMVNGNNCYYPSVNNLEENHYIAHYSVDGIFNKHKMPNLNISNFPNNLFYNQAKKWITQL